MAEPNRWAVHFKAHSQSSRIYTTHAESKATAHFVAAALRNAHWTVIGQPVRVVTADG